MSSQHLFSRSSSLRQATSDPSTTRGRSFAPAIQPHHSAWTIALHWFSVLALVACAGAALWRLAVEDKDLRVVLMEVHRQAGLLVMLGLALRLLARFRFGMANHAGDSPAWQRWAAQMAHLGLYGLLLLMPLLGWAASNAHNVKIKLFGLVALPVLVAEDSDLADTLDLLHTWGAWLILAMVVAHVGAACWHHWRRRDGVLVAMLPLMKRLPPR
jgi:cytochrome b561